MLALRDRALLSCDEHGRYMLHELVRRYAAEQLASRPDEEGQVRASHAAYYANFVAQHAGALCQTPQARDAVSREIANVRTAWEWAVTHRDVHLLVQMRPGLVAWYELAGQLEDVERRNLLVENLPAHRDLLRLWPYRRHLRGIAATAGPERQRPAQQARSAMRDPSAGVAKRAREEAEPALLSLVRQGPVYQDAAVV